MLPAQAQDLIPIIEGQGLWVDIPIHERPFASSFIMQNNIQVAFLAFGSGVLAGLPTVWIMIFNGLIIGGITGLTITMNKVGEDPLEVSGTDPVAELAISDLSFIPAGGFEFQFGKFSILLYGSYSTASGSAAADLSLQFRF